jgi:excisionase family DNA binding protein
MIAAMPDRLMNVPEVAARLGVKDATVREWLKTGRLKGFRLGGARLGWKVRESDVDAFIRDLDSDEGTR